VLRKAAAKSIMQKPATEKYPAQKREVADNFRGEPVLDTELCIGCGICSRECPAKAIVMVDVAGKKRPQFELAHCIFCYHCADFCPKKAIKNSTNFELATINKASLEIKPQPPKST
jgi:formate hydrogenlyase subunit 6/NADH:ubiquinone oxidoreductase subunit I